MTQVHAIPRLRAACLLTVVLSLPFSAVPGLGQPPEKASAAPPPLAGPKVLFRDHGTFRGVILQQQGDNMTGQPQKKQAALSLPAGTYRVYLDFRAVSPVPPGKSYTDSAFFALVGAETAPGQTASVGGATGGRGAGRNGDLITLTAPFSGEAVYGGGSLGPEEIWFSVVSADDPGYLPLPFGPPEQAPRPLKRGADNAAQGTLPTNDPYFLGDWYYMRLPAGDWRVSLKAAPDRPQPLPAGESSDDYGATAQVLDQWGMTYLASLAPVGYAPGGVILMQTVMKADAAEFIKLHVIPFGKLPSHPVPPIRYTLMVEPALASDDRPAVTGVAPGAAH